DAGRALARRARGEELLLHQDHIADAAAHEMVGDAAAGDAAADDDHVRRLTHFLSSIQHGGPRNGPQTPNAQRAPGNPWRASKHSDSRTMAGSVYRDGGKRSMCGIVGILDRSGEAAPVGATALAMLSALGCRGPDSAGIALWGAEAAGHVLRIKPGDGSDPAARRREITRRAARFGRVRPAPGAGALMRLCVEATRPDDGAPAVA